MSKLLLLSGGIDSLALAAWTKPAICLTIDYGQRAARAEIQASNEICKALGLRHDTISAPIPSLGMGDMSDQAVSRHSKYPEFWPFRNQYLVTNLSESIVIDMIKYVYEMQENDRRPQAWASRVAGDAATSNQGHP